MPDTDRHTDRLLLRPVTEADLDRMLEYRNLPEVTNWLIHTVVEPDAFREAWRKAADNPADHSVAAVLDGTVIGTVSLELDDGMIQPGGPPRTEALLGYIFDPAFAGQGYATEAVREVLHHAFTTLGVRRVTAGCFADNHASVRILEKMGMRREQHGVQDSWHADHGWIDGYTYALLADEWSRR